VLRLIEDQPGARLEARRVVAQLPRDEPWRLVLERLLGAGD
jgi:hypothetical protein